VDEATIDEETVRTPGAFYHGLMIGVMAQWLMDPKQAPSARDLAEAVCRLTAGPRPGTKARKEKRHGGPNQPERRPKAGIGEAVGDFARRQGAMRRAMPERTHGCGSVVF
jgi:hypothetical protein